MSERNHVNNLKSVVSMAVLALIVLPESALASTCMASSKTTMDSCMSGVVAGTYDSVEVTQTFDCPTTGADCSYLLRGLGSASRPIEIYGSTPSVTIYRNPSVRTFRIEDSHNVTIRDLRLWERNKRNHNYQDCNFLRPDSAPIVIDRNLATGAGKSTSIILANISIDTGEPDAIQVGRADNVNLLDSRISGAGHFGLWTSNQFAKNTVRVFDNEFTGIGANAILLANTKSAWINGNEMWNNHVSNPFCLPNGQHTGGGQMVVEQGVQNLTIQSNHIHSGGNAAVNGIEFADGSGAPIKNVLLLANYIYGNPAGGVILNPFTLSHGVGGVSIRENVLYSNGALQIRVNGHRDVDIWDNYYTQDLSLSPRANFTGTPKTCSLGGQSTCSVNVTWSTQQASGVSVIVDGTGLFSSNSSGTSVAPWINSTGVVFEIFSTNTGAEPIARRFVKGL